ncbi:MAG: FAD:protein FMN transferase [Pirellulales bacterium]
MACVVGFSVSSAAELRRFDRTERHMGMPVRIVLYAADEPQADAGFRAAFAKFAALDAIFSDYKPESELSQLSAAAPTKPGEAIPIGEDMRRLLRISQTLSERSDGAFDITIGPLTSLWRKSKRSRKLPEPDVLSAVRDAVGYRNLKLTPDGRGVELLKPGMRLDAGGIAAGYAVDRALEDLKSKGIASAMIDASGDIGCSAAPPGTTGWRIGVAPLDPSGPPSRYLRLANVALTTSGDAYQATTIDGVRYSHIVDPRTGLGLTRSMAATIIAPTCVDADSLATTVCVLGHEKGAELLKRYPGASALILLAPERRAENPSPLEPIVMPGWEAWEEKPTLAPEPTAPAHR